MKLGNSISAGGISSPEMNQHCRKRRFKELPIVHVGATFSLKMKRVRASFNVLFRSPDNEPRVLG